MKDINASILIKEIDEENFSVCMAGKKGTITKIFVPLLKTFFEMNAVSLNGL